MARIRNQNSVPDAAITASDEQRRRAQLDASSSDSAADTSSDAEQHLEAEHRPVLHAPHPGGGGQQNTAQTTNAPPAVGSSPRDLPAREVEHEVGEGDRDAPRPRRS